MEKLKLEYKNFYVMPFGRFVYEVDNERERHVMDLVGRTCSRREWDLTGILCKHGVAAIVVNREKLEDYTHPCYYKDAVVETYKTPYLPCLANLSGSQVANSSLLHLLSISHQAGHP